MFQPWRPKPTKSGLPCHCRRNPLIPENLGWQHLWFFWDEQMLFDRTRKMFTVVYPHSDQTCHTLTRRKPDTEDRPVYVKFKGRWNWLMMVGTRIMVVFAGEWVTGMRHERGIWRARLQMVMVNIWETSLSCPGIIYVIFYMHVFCMHISLNENYTLKILLGMTHGTQMGHLWQHRRVGWGERWEGGWRGRGHMYTYGWTMLMYGRNQHNIVIILKLKINKEKKIPPGQRLRQGFYRVSLISLLLFLDPVVW